MPVFILLSESPPGLKRILTFLLLCLCYFTPLQADTISAAKESELRAAIILGIVRFTRWPESAEVKNSLNLCLAGKPRSAEILGSISGKHRYKEIPINIHHIDNAVKRQVQCHAIVTGSSGANTLPSAKHGILTICDGCNATLNNPMVSLIRKNNRIGFEINLDVSKSAGISFSSSLLELASNIRGGHETN